MIPNLQTNTTYAVHLRAATATGSKDWVGSVTSQGELHTYWGKTGHINQHAGKRGDLTALNGIVSQKVNGENQYRQVDEYTPHQGWQSQRTQAAPPPPKPKAPPAPAPLVDWNREAPDASIKWDF